MIYKKIFYILFVFVVVTLPSFAEKIPVKISPIQIISTHHDEIETGDWIKFETVKDVFIDEKLYIPQSTEIIGVVDFVHQNGWAGDSAEIKFKNFYTKDINNKKVLISYPLDLEGNVEMANDSRQFPTGLVSNLAYYINRNIKYANFLIRGSEIFIEPDTKTFNVFLTQ